MRSLRIWHVIPVAVILLLSTTPARAEVVNGIAAVVNDEVITLLDVEREAALLAREPRKRPDGASIPSRDDLRKQALDRLIERSLIQQKIRQLGISVSEEEIRLAIEDVKKQNNLSQEALSKALASQGLSFEQYRAQLTEQLQRLKLMSQEVRARIQVMESDITEYYQSHPGDFTEEEKFHARHIFFRLPASPSPEELKQAGEKARSVRERLMKGADFVSLARELSEDPGAPADGGDLGTFRAADMVPEIASVIAGMSEGEVSEPVRSSAGLHVIRLEKRIPPRVRPLDEVRRDIEEIVYRRKSEERFSQWASELRRGASIELPGS